MNKISIVITTCNGFNDLWDNNLYLLDKFWENHPNVHLISDCGDYRCNCNKSQALHFTGEYTDRLYDFLATLDDEYILLTLDDYLVCKRVDDDKIKFLVNYMKNQDIDYCRLYDKTKIKKWYDKENNIHELTLKKRAYEVNLYPSIWKKTSLMALLKKPESPWKFEVRLTRRCRELGYKCVWVDNKKIFEFVDTIRKGKYLYSGQSFLKKQKLFISDRKIRTLKETAGLYIRTIASRYMPTKLKSFLRKKSKMAFFSDYADTED